jgi:hypothetical protein
MRRWATLAIQQAPHSARGADAEPIALAVAQRDLRSFETQLKDRRVGNEDLIGSLNALARAFFDLGRPTEPDPAAGTYPADVRRFQDEALDAVVKALRLGRPLQSSKDKTENVRNDVNLMAAQVLGELLGDPRLGTLGNGAVIRTPAEVRDARALRSGQVIDALGKELAEKKRWDVPQLVLEAAYAALGRMNDPSALVWVAADAVGPADGAYEAERRVAAHKALMTFSDVPGRTRFGVVQKLLGLYVAKAAAAAQAGNGSPVFASSAALVIHFATPPGGAPPAVAGRPATTLRDLDVWFREHSDPTKPPWL